MNRRCERDSHVIGIYFWNGLRQTCRKQSEKTAELLTHVNTSIMLSKNLESYWCSHWERMINASKENSERGKFHTYSSFLHTYPTIYKYSNAPHKTVAIEYFGKNALGNWRLLIQCER